MSYDPAYTKNPTYSNMAVPVSAQPAPAAVNVTAQPAHTYSYNAGPTVAAAPVTHQPNHPGHVFSPRPPPGRWGDGICDWPKNLFPSCYCACCCCYGMWLAAQSKSIMSILVEIYNLWALMCTFLRTIVGQKVGYSSFQCPIWTYVILWIIGLIVTLATGNSVFIVFIPMIFAFCFALGLRLHIANRENITEFGGCFGEFCCGFWCWYCSVSQSKDYLKVLFLIFIVLCVYTNSSLHSGPSSVRIHEGAGRRRRSGQTGQLRPSAAGVDEPNKGYFTLSSMYASKWYM